MVPPAAQGARAGALAALLLACSGVFNGACGTPGDAFGSIGTVAAEFALLTPGSALAVLPERHATVLEQNGGMLVLDYAGVRARAETNGASAGGRRADANSNTPPVRTVKFVPGVCNEVHVARVGPQPTTTCLLWSCGDRGLAVVDLRRHFSGASAFTSPADHGGAFLDLATSGGGVGVTYAATGSAVVAVFHGIDHTRCTVAPSATYTFDVAASSRFPCASVRVAVGAGYLFTACKEGSLHVSDAVTRTHVATHFLPGGRSPTFMEFFASWAHGGSDAAAAAAAAAAADMDEGSRSWAGGGEGGGDTRRGEHHPAADGELGILIASDGVQLYLYSVTARHMTLRASMIVAGVRTVTRLPRLPDIIYACGVNGMWRLDIHTHEYLALTELVGGAYAPCHSAEVAGSELHITHGETTPMYSIVGDLEPDGGGGGTGGGGSGDTTVNPSASPSGADGDGDGGGGRIANTPPTRPPGIGGRRASVTITPTTQPTTSAPVTAPPATRVSMGGWGITATPPSFASSTPTARPPSWDEAPSLQEGSISWFACVLALLGVASIIALTLRCVRKRRTGADFGDARPMGNITPVLDMQSFAGSNGGSATAAVAGANSDGLFLSPRSQNRSVTCELLGMSRTEWAVSPSATPTGYSLPMLPAMTSNASSRTPLNPQQSSPRVPHAPGVPPQRGLDVLLPPTLVESDPGESDHTPSRAASRSTTATRPASRLVTPLLDPLPATAILTAPRGTEL